MNLTKQAGATIERFHMLQEKDAVLVGLSGGADSVCLLRVLLELRSRGSFRGEIRAVHVHHGLRAAADEDEAYVRRLCEEWEVPLKVHHVDAAGFAREHGTGIEEGGHLLRMEIFRQERQELLGQMRKDPDTGAGDVKIALAHHLEDRVETLIFNMARGSALAGIAGILPVSGNIIRPLIAQTREEIEQDLEEHGISWRVDESNEDLTYSRNRIRHRILPELEKLNDQALSHCGAAADTVLETEQYLERQTAAAIVRCSIPAAAGEPAGAAVETRTGAGSCAMSIPALLQEDPLIRKRALYQLLVRTAGRKKDIAAAHVEALLHLCGKTGNGSLTLPYGILAEKRYDLLLLQGGRQEENSMAVAFCCPYPMREEDYEARTFPYGHDPALIPRNEYTKWFDYDKISLPVEFRRRQPKDRMCISADGRRKPLTRCMIDAKIPRAVRERMILPAAGSDILWLPGSRMSEAFRVEENTRTILELRLRHR